MEGACDCAFETLVLSECCSVLSASFHKYSYTCYNRCITTVARFRRRPGGTLLPPPSLVCASPPPPSMVLKSAVYTGSGRERGRTRKVCPTPCGETGAVRPSTTSRGPARRSCLQELGQCGRARNCLIHAGTLYNFKKCLIILEYYTLHIHTY